VLRVAIGGGAMATLAGVVALVRSGGYAVPEGPALASLSAARFAVVLAAARRICAPDRPVSLVSPSPPSADEVGVARFVDAYVAKMSPRVGRDLMRLLDFIEQLAPALIGATSRFTRLLPAEQDEVLASLERSRSDLLRGGWDGLKTLVFMGYYRDPRTWPVLGYDGPRVGRP
jgi:hypothetical protein